MATIEIQESVVTRLTAQAKAEGLSLEAYLERLSELRPIESGKLPRLRGEELDTLLDAEASEDFRYKGSYSRADIYLDHD